MVFSLFSRYPLKYNLGISREGPDGFLVWSSKNYTNKKLPADIITIFKVSVMNFQGF